MEKILIAVGEACIESVQLISEILADFIESNLRQRVIGNANPIKLGRCFTFLNEYYGFEKGTNQHSSLENNFTSSNQPHNQTELAESYDITKQTMNNYMRLAEMIPEMEELIDTGIVTKTTVLAMMRQLLNEEK